MDLWWIITTANPDVIRRDRFNLKPGMEIRIPNNAQGIIEAFETHEINYITISNFSYQNA